MVENRLGANGFIAAKAVAEAPADCYTMFVASNSPMVTNAAVFKQLPYDPVKDFAPVASIARLPIIIGRAGQLAPQDAGRPDRGHESCAGQA